MIKSKKGIMFVIILMMTLSCAPNTLRKWVKQRGYNYYKDYSTINILGYEETNETLRINSYLIIHGKKGEIPDLVHEQNRLFKIEGKTEVENFLKTVTGGNITGKFEIGASAEINLQNPFKEEASAFIPSSPCDNRMMSIVTKVLNTGNMRVKVKDKMGLNITSSFKPKQVGRVEGSLVIEYGDEITISGKGFYVGYLTEWKQCQKIKGKDIILKRGQPRYDGDIGIYAIFVDYKKENYFGKGLVYISPSHYIGLADAQKGIEWVEKNFGELYQMIKKGGKEGVEEIKAKGMIKDPWEEAIVPSTKGETEFSKLTSAQAYILTFGDRLGIPGIPNLSGIYIEVQSVAENEVRLKTEQIRYEDVKR